MREITLHQVPARASPPRQRATNATNPAATGKGESLHHPGQYRENVALDLLYPCTTPQPRPHDNSHLDTNTASYHGHLHHFAACTLSWRLLDEAQDSSAFMQLITRHIVSGGKRGRVRFRKTDEGFGIMEEESLEQGEGGGSGEEE